MSMLSNFNDTTFSAEDIGTPQIIDADVSVEFDDPDFSNGGMFIVQGHGATDTISIVGSGLEGDGINIVITEEGLAVYYNGGIIGYVDVEQTGEEGSPLAILLGVGTTPEALQALVQSLAYSNLSGEAEPARLLEVAIIRFTDAELNEETIGAVITLTVEGPSGEETPTNAAPELTFEPDSVVAVDLGGEISLNLAEYFTDADEDELTYAATFADGSPLPEWLVLADAVFGGTVPFEVPAEFGDITITASDGQDTVSFTFALSFNDVEVIEGGSEEDDDLTGSEGDDRGDLGGGNDNYDCGDGNDAIFGGLGDDTVIGGLGDDSLVGEDGIDDLDGGEGDDRLDGGTGDDDLDGGTGDDELDCGDGDDVASGGDGGDTLDGGIGSDSLNGGSGIDTLSGGDGNDTLSGGLDNDTLDGGTGVDTLDCGSGNDEASGGLGNDILRGGMGRDKLHGGDGNDNMDGGNDDDAIDGGVGTDTLRGGAGKDRLDGGAGADRIIGDAAKDTMIGGTGNDVFDFDGIVDIGKGTTRDVIKDFAHGLDDFDLRTIDASSKAGGNQAFKFIGTKAFHKVAGELHFLKTDVAGTASDKTIVEGDINGDGKADFQIELTGLKGLTAIDFML
jgi:Ca2+-binding RTX toxin-like protein